MKLLFVCLGNICRSPAAQRVMEDYLKKHNLENIFCDSCATSSNHEGSPPDARMIDQAKKRNYFLEDLRSRAFKEKDFEEFDYIFTMDLSNLKNVKAKDPDGSFSHKVFPITYFCKKHSLKEVPDPYYKGVEGFELVLDLLEDACEQIALKLKNSKKL